MEKLLTSFKAFWNKGKSQKAIVIIAGFLLIGIISSLSSQDSNKTKTPKKETKEEIKLELKLDKETANVGDIVKFDITTNPKNADTSEYDWYIHFNKTISEVDIEKNELKVIGIGEDKIYVTLKKDDETIKSNVVKLTTDATFVSISAEYTGSTKSDTTIDNNALFNVKGTTAAGEQFDIKGWEIVNPGVLQPEETSTFTIKYRELTFDIPITCTSSKPMTMGQSNALKKAYSYLDAMPFSYSSLVKQLEYEGFSHEDSVFAVDRCGADWNEQAVKKAQSYLNIMSFSRKGLIDQLKYEGFTQEQAEHAVSAVGY